MANKVASLTRSADFESLKKTGKKIFSAYIIFNYRLNDLDFSRLGMTISRKTGNAVTRNKLKRWSRQVMRKELPQLKSNVDINLILRVSNEGDFFKKLKFADFSEKLHYAINKIK